MTDNKLIVDVTTIITFISDICNDSCIKDRFEDWNDRSKLIASQIKDEENDAIFPKLQKLFDGKDLYTTFSAWNKATNLINNYGSELEKENLKKLKERLTLVEDDSSERIEKLNSKYWSDLNKSVFGTADKLNMKVVTGNINAINSLVNEHDFDIEYIAHRSRCFVGRKYIKKID